MKAENALYVSVIIREDKVDVAGNFDYYAAKDDMVKMLDMKFDVKNDDGLIFKMEKGGLADPIFNYRAHLNKEIDHYKPAPKSNQNIKIFFECPKCHGHKFKIVPDEDGDFFANCSNKECNHYELIQH